MLKTRQREEQEQERQQQEHEQQQQRRRQWQRSSQHAMQLCSVCVQVRVRVCVCVNVSWKSTPCQGCKGKESEERSGEWERGVLARRASEWATTKAADCHCTNSLPTAHTLSLLPRSLSLCMTSLCFNANMRLLIIIKTTTKRNKRVRENKSSRLNVWLHLSLAHLK